MRTLRTDSLLVLDTVPEGYIRLDPEFRFTFLNRAAEKILGIPRKEVLGKKLPEIHLEIGKRFEENVRRTMAERTSIRFDNGPEPSFRGYAITSFPDPAGGIILRLSEVTEGRNADQKKRRGPERYRRLFDALHEGLAIHRLTFRNNTPENYVFLNVNSQYKEIFRLRRETVINRLATDVFCTPDAPYLKEYSSAVQSHNSIQFESWDAKVNKHLAISVAPMGADLFATTVFDITDRKNAEERYRLIAENATDVIWLWDVAKDQCIYISPSILRLRGFSPEEIMAQPLHEAMSPAEYQLIVTQTRNRVAAVEAGDESARTATNEVEYNCKDGSKVIAERITTLISDEHGKVRHILGVSRDITARRRMSDALRQSEEKFAKAFRSNPAAITIVDIRDACYLEVNDTFVEQRGYGRDEVIGRNWADLEFWADPLSRDDAIRQLRKDGRLRNWEFRFRKKNGQIGTGLLSAELIQIDGRECAMTATVDITERVELQNQILQAQKLESVGRLAGGVAHDFNNLLTVICGYSEFLAEALGKNNELLSDVEEIKRAADSARDLTQQLLAFSRKQVIAARPLNLNDVVRDADRMLKRLIGEDVELISRLDPQLGRIMADPNQIRQVIVNLVVNARDAMPRGGRVVIETANTDVDESLASDNPDAVPGRHILMTVSDSGAGMTEEDRQKIFEPFFTTKGHGKGTGLGLSTVYGIVRQSGGWIGVSTKLGHGSSFRIYLPRVDAQPVVESVLSPATADALRGDETVLVVEDEAGVCKLTTTIVAGYGYRVLVAHHGAEAIAVAAKYSGEIHLLLTDVILPGMNGKELSEHLNRVRPGLKTLFTSGYSDDVIAHRGVLDPKVAYIPKPFTAHALGLKIRAVLGQGRSDSVTSTS